MNATGNTEKFERNDFGDDKETPYTPQQNGVPERKNRALKEMVNSMLSYSGLSEGFCGEAIVVVRLPDPKRKTLGEKGIDCIFVGYVEHSKAYRFYVIEPNDSVSINSTIESRDAIFDENRFSLIPRPKDIIPIVQESQRDDHFDEVPIEGSRDQVGSQYFYCFSIEEDPRTYTKAMQSRDAALWKEAINDDIGSIMENNTWVLSDLPPGCKPLGFRQKEGIDYFDTYAPVARITTIRLLLALATIHNLVIHQMNVKTTFLKGDLDEKVYMKQPEGFVIPGNEHKVCKLVKSLYGLKQAPKQWHQKFDEVVLSSGFLLNQSDNTRRDIGYVIGRLSRFTSNPSRQHWKAITRVFKYLRRTKDYDLSYVGYPSVLEGYSDARWINHVEDSSSTSGWVFLLGGGAISWACKKQTCITGSTMESEFVAFAAGGKEVKWLRNLIHENPIWPKLIAPISFRCDSAPTMARAYSQIYNGESRDLGVRHSMVRELIRNGVITIEFFRTQCNLASCLMKGLARDLVIKSRLGMSLKSS
ncbi:zinc finger, CCHC-type containing protein [Tanacetum coccineum]